MKHLSPLAHPLGNASPTVGMRDWLAGARPVAGAVAASGLMLLACSWFFIGAGRPGGRHDVGQPSPVRLQENPAQRTGPASPIRTRKTHTRVDAARATTAPQQHKAGPLVGDAGTPSASTPAPQAGRPDSPAPQPTRATSTPATSQPSATTTTNLPAPLDELPTSVTVPSTPVTPGVTVPLPQTPPVPPPSDVVTNATSTLGLP